MPFSDVWSWFCSARISELCGECVVLAAELWLKKKKKKSGPSLLWFLVPAPSSVPQFSSVPDGIFMFRKAHTLHPISQKFPQHYILNSFSVCLIDDCPFLSFQGRLSGSSSFFASLLQAIDGVMSLALCPQIWQQTKS